MMERLHRLHRLAILRGDLLAIAVLEGRIAAMWRTSLEARARASHEFTVSMVGMLGAKAFTGPELAFLGVSESELRLMDGNR